MKFDSGHAETFVGSAGIRVGVLDDSQRSRDRSLVADLFALFAQPRSLEVWEKIHSHLPSSALSALICVQKSLWLPLVAAAGCALCSSGAYHLDFTAS